MVHILLFFLCATRKTRELSTIPCFQTRIYTTRSKCPTTDIQGSLWWFYRSIWWKIFSYLRKIQNWPNYWSSWGVINFVYLPIINLQGVFLKCGDYKMGVARIKCTNSNCNHDFFVPLSCLSFYLCPSCVQHGWTPIVLIIRWSSEKNSPFWRTYCTWSTIRIFGSDGKARESLAQYIARCPISLEKIKYESFHAKVLFTTPKYNDYFKKNFRVFDVPVVYSPCYCSYSA